MKKSVSTASAPSVVFKISRHTQKKRISAIAQSVSVGKILSMLFVGKTSMVKTRKGCRWLLKIPALEKCSGILKEFWKESLLTSSEELGNITNSRN